MSPSSSKPVLVIGGGIAGLTAAVELADAGCQVILVEKSASLGGQVARMHQYFPKLCPPACGLEMHYRRIRDNPAITVLTLAEVSPNATLEQVDAFCWRGGFPELWQRPELDRDLWLGSYLATYLERDVRNVLNIGSLRDFDRFLRAAAIRVGQLVSLAELARDVGIAPNTAKSWLSVLEASRQLFLVEPYHRSAGKRLIKTPKLYFADSGLLVYLLGFPDWAAVAHHAAWGAIWENLVISEVWKQFQNRGERPPCWFWRTVQGEEIDLLIERGPGQFLAIECKVGVEPGRRSVKGFPALEKVYGPEALRRGAVVCRTPVPYPLAEKSRIAALPLGGPEGVSAWIRRHMG